MHRIWRFAPVAVVVLVLGARPAGAGVRDDYTIVKDAQGWEYVADQVLVKFLDPSGEPAQAAISRLGAQVVDDLGDLDILVLQLPPATTVQQAIADLNATGLVAFAEPNYLMHILDVPNDPRLYQQWGLGQINCYNAWDLTHGDLDVRVAVIDTGVRYTHQDLAGRVELGWDYVNGDADPWDDHGHGTHVTGIGCAITNNALGIAGVSWNTWIHAYKTIDSTGSGLVSWSASAVNAARVAGDDVINMSIGGPSTSSMSSAINAAWNAGLLPVAAAGNNGSTNPLYPAAYANCMAVAASTSSDTRWGSSNYGSWVDVAAPGVSIMSCWYSSNTAYTYLSGTSMATPHVSGEGVLMFAILGTDAPVSLIRNLIQDNADPGAGNYWLNYVTYGRINCFASASAAMDARPCLTMQVSPPGGGTTSPPAGSDTCTRFNEFVNISATPNEGYEFVNWTGPVNDPNNPSTKVLVSADVTVTANFQEVQGQVCGDFDGDGDVDLDDFGSFAACYNGANNPPAPSCPAGVDADCDGDGDVDLDDFGILAANYTGSL